MRDLLKTAIILALAFASTFLVIRALGLFPEEGVIAWLEGLRQVSPWWLAAGVVALLFLDLLIAIPTMTTMLLAGWLLGPLWGGMAATFGLMMMGSFGYGMGRVVGRPVLRRIIGNQARLDEIGRAFSRNDILTLVVCQALPILPEVCAVIAGVSKMNPIRFAFGFFLGCAPYAFILAYAGSISSADDLRPAIFGAIGVTVVLVLIWGKIARRA